MAKKKKTPRSFEVRDWDRIYRAHTGATSDLVQIAVEGEMERELQRSQAVQGFVGRLLRRSILGPLIGEDIKEELEEWYEEEVLGEDS